MQQISLGDTYHMADMLLLRFFFLLRQGDTPTLQIQKLARFAFALGRDY
jgi:hypothetical protein